VDFFIGSAPVGAPGNGGMEGMSAIILSLKDKRRRAAVKFNSETKLKRAQGNPICCSSFLRRGVC